MLKKIQWDKAQQLRKKNNAIFWKFAGWMSSLLFFNTSLFEKYI